MKRKLLILTLATIAFGGVQAQETYSGLPTGDTYIRSDQADSKYGNNNNNTIQLQTYSSGITTYGVVSLQFTEPNDGNEVKSAVLRMTTRGCSDDKVVNVYALPEYVDAENATWNSMNSMVEKALATTPIASFTMVGAAGKNPEKVDAGSIASWQNNIDLTDYVKKLAGNKFSVLLVRAKDANSSFNFYDKETTGKTWSGGTAIADEDMRPLFTVEYQPFSLSQANYAGLPTGDTWVRSDKPEEKESSVYPNVMQMQTYAVGITSYGVMSFEFAAAEDGNEVKSAVLRTMTRVFNGGDRTLKVYALPKYVDAESTTWNSLGSDLATALASEPIASITIAGQLGKNITNSDLNVSMQNVAAWQNTIDLSEYVKTLNTNKFSILIAKVDDVNKNSQFFTKEAPAMNWDASINDGAAISVDDIRPLFTVTYKPATYKLTVTDAGAATLVLPFDATIPSGVKAYTLAYTGGDAVVATEITTGTIAANTPVLVNAVADDYDFVPTSSWVSGGTRPTSGALTGVYGETIVPTGSYILTKNGENVGFRKVDGLTNTVAANRAYLTANGAGARLNIVFDDEATGIDTVNALSEAGVVYNLQGVRVENPTKGIYVKNGKKFIVK